jgi:uncharacterized membrane protein
MDGLVKTGAQWAASGVEEVGVVVIAAFSVYALWVLIAGLVRGEGEGVYQRVRRRLGRGILLGLEFLVAGDIIHTVAVELTFETVGVLAIIVLIRTFLSFALEVELNGRWPWQGEQEKAGV